MKRNMKCSGARLLIAVFLLGAVAEAAVLAYDGFDVPGENDANAGVYKKGRAIGKSPNNEVFGGRIIGFDESIPWVSESGVIQVAEDGPVGGSAVSKRTKSTSALRLGRDLTSPLIGKQVVYASARLRMDLKYTGTYKAQAFVGFSKGLMASSAGAGIGMMWDVENKQWDLVARYNKGKADVAPIKKGLGAEDTGSVFVVWKMDAQNNVLDVWVEPADLSDLKGPATASFADYMGSVSKIENICFYSRWLIGSSRSDGVGFYFDELTLGDAPEDVMSVLDGE